MTEDYCIVCGNKMRKWISEDQCNAMCVNQDCINNGRVFRTIEDITSFKFNMSVKV